MTGRCGVKRVRAALVAAVVGIATVGAAPASVVERLQYLAFYQGVLSAGQALPIADVELRTSRRAAGAPIRETQLAASSENYAMVESLYPMRYRFRSWATGDGLLAFESYRKTRRLRHRLYVRSAGGDAFERFDLHDGQGRRQLGALESGSYDPVPPGPGTGDALIDRLGMLQRIRDRKLAVGDVVELPVTGGNKAFRYRVTVEAAQTVEAAGRAVPALRLRFEGFRVDQADGEQRAHRPVHIWVHAGDGHVPLLAEARHPIGVFRVELVGDETGALPLVSLR
jgi:hypothetical protein